MSVNGFIADRHGQTDFLVSDSSYDPAPFFGSIDTVVMGRVTYESAIRQGMRAYEDLRNYVVSRKKAAADNPDDTMLRDANAVAHLLRTEGKDIW
jgi:dihydrofolate reductase